ncbi:hypothetical protein BJ546DRAFT_164687 [Cryomyces antarcticus]
MEKENSVSRQADVQVQKRPSRFDRKYYFPVPNLAERVQYCKYWQHKLSDNKDIEFPDKLCVAIAKITDGFSFAYMQEAFVAALLAIAAGGDKPDSDATEDDEGDGDLESLLLWREIKKQVQLLKDELDKGDGGLAEYLGMLSKIFSQLLYQAQAVSPHSERYNHSHGSHHWMAARTYNSSSEL